MSHSKSSDASPENPAAPPQILPLRIDPSAARRSTVTADNCWVNCDWEIDTSTVVAFTGTWTVQYVTSAAATSIKQPKTVDEGNSVSMLAFAINAAY